ncbi:DUF1569 domain-containing protein [Flavobacterium sp.]|uniref:DUF1569 domain-containing protein n=1 Tax=Flavobacterium sp. TaxID=239 RepID=UPI00286B77D6|nr:DUF1569 domain-containing protein [Flavobacterium sp.]
MKKIILLLNELETKIVFRDIENSSVSKSAVSWHIDHTLRVLSLVIETLKNTKPTDAKRKFNILKQLVFITGIIPRGKAKAPKSVQSFEEITLETLKLQFKETRFLVSLLNHLNVNSSFIHPYFGVLNLKETEKFLYLHTKHHIKIINDIIQKKS